MKVQLQGDGKLLPLTFADVFQIRECDGVFELITDLGIERFDASEIDEIEVVFETGDLE